MKRLSWLLLLCGMVPCGAQTPCSVAALADVAAQIHGIRDELKHIQVTGIDTRVPPAARDELARLKSALSCGADAALAHAGPSVDPVELQNNLTEMLSASPSGTAENGVATNRRPSDDAGASPGPYGPDLSVRVSRPPNATSLLGVEFSFDIECSDDHVLLVYTPRNGAWRRLMRWQAPPLTEISDAFGDFFAWTALIGSGGADSPARIVIAHGTPWCTSRFSGFKIDVLSASSDPDSAKVLWHTERGYSRGDFIPKLRSWGDVFELRVNESAFDGFERSVIYRYRVDKDQGVRRIEPLAIHARGFVEEWLTAPWSEAVSFSAEGAASELKAVHDAFAKPDDLNREFVTYRHGPVRACRAPGIFQVQINSTLEKVVPGKPGGESQPLPSHFFHVREAQDGYVMLSAPTEPDPTCRGADLMSTSGN
jgi:hypothetical protein